MTEEIPVETIVSKDVRQCPFHFYQRLRTDEPLARVNMPAGNSYWLLTRYEDTMTLLKDPRIVNDYHKIQDVTTLPRDLRAAAPGEEPHPFEQANEHLLYKDAPDHTRLRKLVSQAFTPRSIERLRGNIQCVVDELLDSVQAQGKIDLVTDFAFPLAFQILSDLLGIPQDMQHQVRAWINAIVSGTNMWENVASVIEYLKTLLAEKRAHPQDDLITRLVQAESDEGSLSEKELVSLLYLIFIAGYETTVSLFSVGTLALLQHPAQLQRLQEDPTLIASAIEELLRYTSPTEATLSRWAGEDLEMYGQVIKKGEHIRASLVSANRDPSRFADPEVLDIGRQENKHLAFGKGIHSCLGAPLARLEGQIVFSTLFRRFPTLQLAQDPDELQWNPNTIFRGITSLPLTFEAKVL